MSEEELVELFIKLNDDILFTSKLNDEELKQYKKGIRNTIGFKRFECLHRIDELIKEFSKELEAFKIRLGNIIRNGGDK